VGIHAATCGMPTNVKYTRILGEVFNGHPPPQWMTLVVESPNHYINDHEPLPGPGSAPSSALPSSINLDSVPAKHFRGSMRFTRLNPTLALLQTAQSCCQSQKTLMGMDQKAFPYLGYKPLGKEGYIIQLSVISMKLTRIRGLWKTYVEL
jgi:hypothetical protein